MNLTLSTNAWCLRSTGDPFPLLGQTASQDTSRIDPAGMLHQCSTKGQLRRSCIDPKTIVNTETRDIFEAIRALLHRR